MGIEEEIIADNDNTALMLIDTLDAYISDAKSAWQRYTLTCRRADLKKFKKLQVKITNLCNQLLTHKHYYEKHKADILEVRDEINDARWTQFEEESL